MATARPGETRTRRSCSAEQGNRVQVPDMGPEPAGFRFRSCDCGALVHARRRALRKRVIGTAVMAGREGRTSALGISLERISQKTYMSKRPQGSVRFSGVWPVCTKAAIFVAAFFIARRRKNTYPSGLRPSRNDESHRQLNSHSKRAYCPGEATRRNERTNGQKTRSTSRRAGAQEAVLYLWQELCSLRQKAVTINF